MASVVKLILWFGLLGLATCATLNILDIYSKPVWNYAVLRSSKPVVAIYYNKACAPCEWILPQIERVAKKKSELIYLAKVNTDKVPGLADNHGVTRFPTTRGIFQGEVVDEVEGGSWGAIVNLINRMSRLK